MYPSLRSSRSGTSTCRILAVRSKLRITMARILLAILIQTFVSVQSFLHQYPKIELGIPDGDDPGEPLFLTPFIESGNITEGRRLAQVPFTEKLNITSFAGFFTVNKAYNSNQFFWYFPAISPKNKMAPVIVWLQGGPGATSLYGLFTENGPLLVHDGNFETRKYNWALSHHIIYIDNPVGTGFSFTNDSRGYCTDETQVGEQLYSTMTQFFQLFPELQKNKFIVTGESYGGKYVPALAYTIHKKNPTARIKINLKGLAIGNGFSDPEHQLVYSKYLYQIGLIDWNQAKVFEEYEKKTIDFIKKQKWDDAFNTFDTLLNGDLINGKTVFQNLTGFDFFYNYLHTKDYINTEFGPMLQKGFVRKGLHVGNLIFNDGKEVEEHLQQDIMKSVAPWICELLDHYYVLIYNGQLDIIVAYPLTVNYLRNLNFTGSDVYTKTAKRYVWKVDGEVAGYVKHAGKLVEVMVRNAGHMVPGDQPKWALNMISTFTTNAH